MNKVKSDFEQRSLLSLLSSSGNLFKILHHLSANSHRFEFPYNLLPRAVRMTLEKSSNQQQTEEEPQNYLYHQEGTEKSESSVDTSKLTSFYRTRITKRYPNSSYSLSLNALEYYLCYFASYATFSVSLSDINQNTSKQYAFQNSLYAELITQYLHFFINSSNSSKNEGSFGGAASPQRYSSSNFSSPNSPGSYYSNKETVSIHSFVQIICEFFLSQTAIEERGSDSPLKNSPQPSSPLYKEERDIVLPSLLTTSGDYVSPTVLTVMGISATLNNINSKTNNLYEHQSINFNSKLKCECIEIMKPYLFHFFQRSFLNCPIYNTSIVEIWMSYCFPWYDRKNPATPNKFSSDWSSFVINNFFFYTELFPNLLTYSIRFSEYDDNHVNTLLTVLTIMSNNDLKLLLDSLDVAFYERPNEANSRSVVATLKEVKTQLSFFSMRRDDSRLFSKNTKAIAATLKEKLYNRMYKKKNAANSFFQTMGVKQPK